MPMIVFVQIVIVIVCLPFVYLGIAHLLPWINRGFALVWQDPSERQRAAILKRLRALLLSNGVPAETAVLMVAKERHVTEFQLLRLLELDDASDVAEMFVRRRSGFGGLLDALNKTFRRGT